jgi:hypothetical protein
MVAFHETGDVVFNDVAPEKSHAANAVALIVFTSCVPFHVNSIESPTFAAKGEVGASQSTTIAALSHNRGLSNAITVPNIPDNFLPKCSIYRKKIHQTQAGVKQTSDFL